MRRRSGSVRIALVGKYVQLHDAYLSVTEALNHASFALGKNAEIKWVDSESVTPETVDGIFADVDGVLVPGGFGPRGIEGKILAAKYARDGKRITVCTGTDGDNVFIRIRDSGPGIPEDELERVKMKFYKGSSKERGSGIGLAVCDEIIKYHGGDLILSNAEGGGTLVTIRIPVEPTF